MALRRQLQSYQHPGSIDAHKLATEYANDLYCAAIRRVPRPSSPGTPPAVCEATPFFEQPHSERAPAPGPASFIMQGERARLCSSPAVLIPCHSSAHLLQQCCLGHVQALCASMLWSLPYSC